NIALMLGGVVLNGAASAMYIGSQFGPGPRDGLMTGLSRVTGASIRLVRTLIEVSVVAVGWLLGGVVGIGTIVYAVGIGPITQALLPAFTSDLRTPKHDWAAHPGSFHRIEDVDEVVEGRERIDDRESGIGPAPM